ncbi:V-type ATP synthase subunit D [Maribellus maritimus]|uniref:V-type ATP synthase subunit D n=1 Tax=Maribellus maritimus TaxID=2870838 RepID=UPI001EEA65C2|nr:V-type ATP synthase subunit D [Maribellus maritimus]MCG6186791.1 V-type ATP synthase subunit D [Maribellus maritimus]
MPLKFQYNKTALQQLNKQLNIRLRALPTLKNKEAALRMEVKKAKDKIHELEKKLSSELTKESESVGLWNEFKPNLVDVGDVKISTKKIAGVKIPVFEKIAFNEKEFSIFENPKWFSYGISIVKNLAGIGTEREFYLRKMTLLDYARKKTTQKVNLYEKVQIPEYKDAIRKIKRFLEDEENLSKSAQKIVKKRQQK